MSTQIYTQTEPYWNGSKLTEATTVKVARTTKAQIQETIARGFAGVSPGAKMITVTVDNAVPSAGFELDPGDAMNGLTPGELTLFAAGKTLTSRGFLIDDDYQQGVNAPATLSFTFVGEWAVWT